MNIVQDNRLYDVSFNSDFSRLKSKLNKFHSDLHSEGAESGIIENFGPVTVITRRSEIYETKCIAYSCYFQQNNPQRCELTLSGPDTKVLFEAVLKEHCLEKFTENKNIINGVEAFFSFTTENDVPKMIKLDKNKAKIVMLPGSVAILQTKITEAEKEVTKLAEQNIEHLEKNTEILNAIEKLQLNDLNQILFSCDVEEKANKGNSAGVYDLPDHGKLPYSGFAGLNQLISEVTSKSQNFHPLCNNLEEGHWLLDYLINRIDNDEFRREIDKIGARLRKISSVFRPRLIIKFIQKTSSLLFSAIMTRLPGWISGMVTYKVLLTQNDALDFFVFNDF